MKKEIKLQMDEWNHGFPKELPLIISKLMTVMTKDQIGKVIGKGPITIWRMLNKKHKTDFETWMKVKELYAAKIER